MKHTIIRPILSLGFNLDIILFCWQISLSIFSFNFRKKSKLPAKRIIIWSLKLAKMSNNMFILIFGLLQSDTRKDQTRPMLFQLHFIKKVSVKCVRHYPYTSGYVFTGCMQITFLSLRYGRCIFKCSFYQSHEDQS